MDTQPVVGPRWKLPFFSIWTGQVFSLAGSHIVRFAPVWQLAGQTGSANPAVEPAYQEVS